MQNNCKVQIISKYNKCRGINLYEIYNKNKIDLASISNMETAYTDAAGRSVNHNELYTETLAVKHLQLGLQVGLMASC